MNASAQHFFQGRPLYRYIAHSSLGLFERVDRAAHCHLNLHYRYFKRLSTFILARLEAISNTPQYAICNVKIPKPIDENIVHGKRLDQLVAHLVSCPAAWKFKFHHQTTTGKNRENNLSCTTKIVLRRATYKQLFHGAFHFVSFWANRAVTRSSKHPVVANHFAEERAA